MDLGIAGRRALVVGASRGLGQAIARALAAEGATVFAAARKSEAIAAWAAGLPPALGERIVATRLDLADLASVDGLADGLLADGGVDILVNNSGGPPPSEARETPRAAWLQNFEAMAANVMHLTQRLLPPMAERRWGRVVTIASSGVEQPIPRLALSNGIRAALVGWSKTLAGEVAGDGITVNMVLPGRIQTERVDELDRAAAARQGASIDDVARAARTTIPAGRYGRPEEFADVVAFLASERAAYVTGTKVRVDGGATRSI